MNEEFDTPHTYSRGRGIDDEAVVDSVEAVLLHWSAYHKAHPGVSMVEYVDMLSELILKNRQGVSGETL